MANETAKGRQIEVLRQAVLARYPGIDIPNNVPVDVLRRALPLMYEYWESPELMFSPAEQVEMRLTAVLRSISAQLIQKSLTHP